MVTEKIIERRRLEELYFYGFVEGARVSCMCGLIGVLCIKPVPEEPTYTLGFDILGVEDEEGSSTNDF